MIVSKQNEWLRNIFKISLQIEVFGKIFALSYLIFRSVLKLVQDVPDILLTFEYQAFVCPDSRKVKSRGPALNAGKNPQITSSNN